MRRVLEVRAVDLRAAATEVEAVVTVAVTKAVVAAAEEKAAAVAEVATDFRPKITAAPFDSRANLAGKRFALTKTPTRADATNVCSYQDSKYIEKNFAAYRGGKWLVAISVTVGALRIDYA